MSENDGLYEVKPEIGAALAAGKPVVALESTVITHGLPYPHNVETALAMEAAVREGGGLPATIALIGGRIHIGLSVEQIEYLARRPRDAVRKCSRRDLPLAIARGEDGSTTVAGTMILAYRAGIDIFATGGIGGVHRGRPFDVSADLYELGRTPVAVVCSGAKSILDLPATCEVLESQGVPLLGYQTDELPAFFARCSGLSVTARVETAVEAAGVLQARARLDLQSGLVIGVPVPEEAALPAAEAEQLIEQALAEADAAGIDGPATTPWLLERLVALSGGRTMAANVALLRNNGRVAGQIAAALAATRIG